MAPDNETNPSPNADAIGTESLRIGKFTVKPFTLLTYILLEQIQSPLVKPYAEDENGNVLKDENGKPVKRPSSMMDTAEALWAFIHSDAPDAMETVRDLPRFTREVTNLAAQMTLEDISQINKDLNKVFEKVGKALKDADLPEVSDGEKKGVIGSSES